MARKKFRLEDVAKKAGVSVATVSRALNDSPLVSARTRDHIHEVLRQAGFSRPRRAEVARPVRTISVVVPPPQGRDTRISDPFLLDLLGGIADALREQQCDMLLSHIMPDGPEAIETLVAPGRSDGLIFVGQSNMHAVLNSMARRSVRGQLPFVVWGAELDDQAYCTIGSDNFRGGEVATSHLIRLGRKRIAFLGDVESWEVTLRYRGYKAALEKAGMTVDPALVHPTQFFVDSAMETVEALLAQGAVLDGIVAASDLIAMGALRSLATNGVSVPRDVSVVGYDDTHTSSFISPSLTTIRQDVALGGRMLVAKLMRRIRGEDVRSEMLATELIVRESCGALG